MRCACLNVELSRETPQLQEINDQLSTLSNDTENPPSQSMLRAIQRHREVYLDYARELRRTKVRVRCGRIVSKYVIGLTWCIQRISRAT